jgi:phosphoglycerate dehydrogenase-like enzyme
MMTMADIPVMITVPFPDEFLERLQVLSPRLKIEVLYTSRALPDLEDVPNLKWVQIHFAGVDHVTDHPIMRSDIKVTTLSGVHAPGMAEFALMAMLGLGRHIPALMEDKFAKRWADNRFERYQPRELRGSTVGIVGYGSVGREIARVCTIFGAEVLATKKDLKHLDDSGFQLGEVGDPQAELARRIYPPEALGSMASLCDFLVITLPLTAQTRGVVDEKIFSVMKPTSYLIDLSRGGVVDHGSLLDALREDRLAGAALDVYPVEPLPESSPLWEMPNVILSPHIAGSSSRYLEFAVDLFAENMKRYLADQPLLNLYDADRGY